MQAKLPLGTSPKRATRQAKVVWKTNIITVGGDAPVRVQSMTNTVERAFAFAMTIPWLRRLRPHPSSDFEPSATHRQNLPANRRTVPLRLSPHW